MRNLSAKRKLQSLCLVALGGTTAYGAISFYKNDEKFYKNFAIPLVQRLDAENAHKLGVLALKYRFFPKSKFTDPDLLKIEILGKEFSNPVGIAAGFDKDGEAILGLNDIGFGFVEIGSVTPEPQPGNEKPRVFRLPEDLAVINRYGFNSKGHAQVLDRLKHKSSGILGVNLGKNKTSPDAIADYTTGINKFGPVADYLVINISSPNTPGLRQLQDKNLLKDLLKAVVEARNNLIGHKPPLLLKLAPDLSQTERKDIAEVILQENTKIDGLIVSNTTVARPGFLTNTFKGETGGLSGKPLKDASTEMISDMYKLTKGQIPIIGVGGIFTGQDAYEKIKAGASVVQLYTSMVYEGPPVVAKIKRELAEILARDGFASVKDAVGVNVKI